MDAKTTETSCELYQQALNTYLEDQKKREARMLFAGIINNGSANNNAEAEKKMQLDIKFQACQFEKMNKIEADLEDVKRKLRGNRFK